MIAIIEIAAAKISGAKVLETFETLVNPQTRVPSEITGLTGITNEMVSSAPCAEQALERLFEFVKDLPIVAHNASFERKFLNSEMRTIYAESNVDPICSLLLSRRVFPQLGSYSLSALVQLLGLERHPAHRAMPDVKMTAHLLRRIEKELYDKGRHSEILTGSDYFRITKEPLKTFKERPLHEALRLSLRRHSHRTVSPTKWKCRELPSPSISPTTNGKLGSSNFATISGSTKHWSPATSTAPENGRNGATQKSYDPEVSRKKKKTVQEEFLADERRLEQTPLQPHRRSGHFFNYLCDIDQRKHPKE